jgi:hypothetical protein
MVTFRDEATGPSGAVDAGHVGVGELGVDAGSSVDAEGSGVDLGDAHLQLVVLGLSCRWPLFSQAW